MYNDNQTLSEAIKDGDKPYPLLLLLMAGFFVCGFQLAFMTVHLPAYLIDGGFSEDIAAYSLALVGLFSIFGALGSGAPSARLPMKWILAFIYATRAVGLTVFLILPMSVFSIYMFSILTGLLWLAPVPPTSGMVAKMFELKYMGTLDSVGFFQVTPHSSL